MKVGIFDRLSVEEEVTAGETVAYDVIADVEATIAREEAADIEADMVGDMVAMDLAVNAGSRLEAQFSAEEELLANPEKITATVVAMSQSAYADTAALLGMDVTSSMLSSESIESNPVTALTISHENAVTDSIKKVYDAIKAIFVKLGQTIKKYVVKAVVWMNGVEKKATLLAKEAAKASDPAKGVKFTEKETNKLAKLVAGWAVVVDGDIDSSGLAAHFGKLSFAGGLDAVSDAVDSVKNTGTEEAPVYEIDEAKVIAAMSKNSPSKAVKVADFAKNTNYVAPSEVENESDITIVPVFAKGIAVTFVETYAVKGSLPVIKVKTVTVNSELYELGKETEPAKAKDVEAYAKGVATFAKGLKKFSDARMKEIDSENKKLDKLAKENTEDGVKGKAGYVLNKLKAGAATTRRDMTVGLALNSILAYAKNTGNLLAYAKMGMSKLEVESNKM